MVIWMKVKNLLLAVRSALSSALTEVKVITEFPDRQQDLPLKQPIISVGVFSVVIESGTDAVNISAGNSPMAVTVRLSICVPKTDEGIKCTELVDQSINVMAGFLSQYSIGDVNVGQTRYSSALGALNTNIDLKFNIGNAF